MLDKDDGDAAVANAGDDLVELAGLARVHARRRLVQQQQPRPGGKRARQLQLALLAVGQVGGLVVLLAG